MKKTILNRDARVHALEVYLSIYTYIYICIYMYICIYVYMYICI